MNLKKNILFALISGLLMALAFPPIPLFILAFFAFVPLFIALDRENTKHEYLLIYLAFFVYHVGTNWWISSWQENTDPFLFASGLMLDVLGPFFFFFPFALYFLIKKLGGRNIALWLFPIIWTTFEWIHSLGDLGYNWLSLAHTQFTNIYWYQIVDIAGVYGATFLVVLVNVLIYKIILKARTMPREKLTKLHLRPIFRPLENKIYLFVIYFVLMLPMVYGYFIIKDYSYDNDLYTHKYINIGLIQPNIDPWNKWEKDNFKQVDVHLRLQDSLYNAVGKINLFIWSETAIPMLNNQININLDFGFVEEQLNKYDASLLTGFAQYYFYKNGEKLPVTVRYTKDSLPYSAFNSAALLNPAPHDTNPQVYHKAKLTPFAEWIPFVNYFPFTKDWINWGVGISAWEKGTETKNLKVINGDANCSIASIICIESIHPDFVRQFVKNGAEILTIITNDAWYDHTTGPDQHYIIGATRAIENRRYLARCANTGITGFISPIGTTILRANQYEPTAIAASIPIISHNELTLYTKYGDYFPIATSIVYVIALIGLLIRKAMKKSDR